ncbi:hypothetical protein BMS3Bbin04_00452 [bacterium BMS3Bbin04]|nr:hypothetical protein BMS3Bbin04_00452 [bacterium BMS3Bbin04]
MNATIRHQLLKDHPAQFPAHWIKARYDNRFRSVINYYIYTGSSFQGANVATFTSNDASLDLIVRKGYGVNCNFRRVLSRRTIDRIDYQFLGFTVSALTRFIKNIFYHRG